MSILFRLVNMLDMTTVDKENVWKIVKQTRKSFLSKHSDPVCKLALLHHNYIKNNINALEENLKLNVTSTPNEATSDTTLKTAAQAYTYLNFCPPKQLSLLQNSIK